MKIADQNLAGIEALGYSAREARFLYLVATYSGYFVLRQWIACTGSISGRRAQPFTQKLERRGHATWREYQNIGGVYHLASKTVYRQIDREHLRNRHLHSTEFIRTRLILLDFILANQNHEYLETEQEKLDYFCGDLGLPKSDLPAKTYGSLSAAAPSIRYFVEGFPLFFDRSEDPGKPILTFSYVDPGRASLTGFRNHLRASTTLFGHLRDFCFIYISHTPARFLEAEECFAALVTTPLEIHCSSELVRYFTLRAAWDQKQYGKFSIEDIEWLDQAGERFEGQETEHLYVGWTGGTVGEQDLRLHAAQRRLQRQVRFSAYLIESAPVKPQKTQGDGANQAAPRTP